MSAAAVATRWLPHGWEAAWTLKVVGASVAVGVAPGLLALLAYGPRPSFGLLELLGFGVGISFALIELLTVAVVTFHWSPVTGISVLAAVAVMHAWLAVRRADAGVSVRMDGGDVLLLGLIGVVAVALYALGSPFQSAEDRYHVSIVQRLAYLDSPSIETLYFSPGVIYIYPYPGTHYLMALMSRVGEIEPIFLYHKLRMFWGAAAIIMLYGCTRALFASARVALVASVVATLFVANGAFATVEGMYWGQLAPHSHASDVAMGVLLPGALLLAFGFMCSREAREARFFLAATMMIVFALVVVHPREIVQFFVYVGAFAGLLFLTKTLDPLRRRAVTVLLATLFVLVTYRVWYEATSAAFSERGLIVARTLVTERREGIRRLLVESSSADLFGPPLPFLEEYMPASLPTYAGWNPIALASGPFILYVFRRNRLAWLPLAAILAYVVIIRFPVVALLYAYVTYFEILYTPVRNVIFFIYMLTGVGVYLIAARLARHNYATLSIGAAVAAAGGIWLFQQFGTAAFRHSEMFLTSLLVAYGIVVGSLLRSGPEATQSNVKDPPASRLALAVALIGIPLTIGTSTPAAAPLERREPSLSTPERLHASLAGSVDDEFRPPPPALISFAHRHIPASGVLAVDRLERHQPALFMPQQMVVWPGEIEGIPNPEELFPSYYRHLKRASAVGRDQPLFHPDESADDRLAFVRDLGVTHVLVNPRLYGTMKPILDNDILFNTVYDDGAWAVYAIGRQ
jgi:hypothetical protein